MTPEPPDYVLWDITYACPLRCTHCYSESGRRPTRQLDRAGNLRVADRLVELRPGGVVLGGGEALVVPGVFDLIERLTEAGIDVVLYTSGWPLRPAMLGELVRLRPAVHVSVDAATAEVHDRIRGRAGSFDRAMAALGLLDRASADLVSNGEKPLAFGIDATIVRSSFPQLDLFCTELAPRFPHLGFISLSSVVPSGLANRQGFVEHELLTDEESGELAGTQRRASLQRLAPDGVAVSTSDNHVMRMDPEAIRSGAAFRAMAVEPDGDVRAMCIYEGTVGNILADPPDLLWKRAVARWSEPFVVEALGSVRTMRDWAAAAREIDRHYGSPTDLLRIERRPDFTATV